MRILILKRNGSVVIYEVGPDGGFTKNNFIPTPLFLGSEKRNSAFQNAIRTDYPQKFDAMTGTKKLV